MEKVKAQLPFPREDFSFPRSDSCQTERSVAKTADTISSLFVAREGQSSSEGEKEGEIGSI